MAFAFIFLGVFAILLWFRDRINQDRKKIVGCAHEYGKVLHAHTDHMLDRAEWLHWQCDDCPFQTPLRGLVGTRWDDVFMYLRGDYEQYGPEHALVMNAQLHRPDPAGHYIRAEFVPGDE